MKLADCYALMLIALGWLGPRFALAQEEERSQHALIVVGLPGDVEHKAAFEEIAGRWSRWLTSRLHFPPDNIAIVFGKSGEETLQAAAATKENVIQAVNRLKRRAKPQDACWVFFLGHADRHDGTVRFHLPGPDLSEAELTTIFADLKCREQVFWFTHSASGWLLRSISRPGRIVVTATEADNEFNETEFPKALAEVIELQGREIDFDGDGSVSVAELFVKASERTQAIFAEDERAPTEHAQLEDNGDGRSVEAEQLRQDEKLEGVRVDGDVARKMIVYAKVAPPHPEDLPAR